MKDSGLQIDQTQPIAERVEYNLQNISQTFSTNQNSEHGIYDYYHIITWC